jgi:hypothetical protein
MPGLSGEALMGDNNKGRMSVPANDQSGYLGVGCE